ncbi:CRISPR-associated endoribonuclease Cas2 [Fundidesulfovibrio magnetotacticus]|uniref:CRISPR-associated endoribonuclease Cas2 n=1 Tax=Fundidesulfovibrio magnetotacticus TaxID=2730080 RepID=A0A6V8LWK0_9BACT|nr:CRISPR-associated endonuclease Cas2 [Fundidesulfovibrio magnetotacticus]GFK95270.1 CRISPR-associated endoribonuclease Cas2 [Fundidesulfovibrio magnetotacticus]
MWVFALFDLPVTAVVERKEYTRFRKELKRLGFSMLQYSVYARYCHSRESKDAFLNKVQALVPDKGEVRLLSVTDAQFGKMRVLVGKKRRKPEKGPEQLMLF